ncbi:hypothetical protein [Chthonobacter rhizosphaerae]|uniref:hypothetical protein n=1 Tax=Chthonobacter rhizosphaerae TaxID=2735553 RepID=UPI0015EF7A01|nr:hypothetical protein [Chthonobacter rhizosphaerae]
MTNPVKSDDREFSIYVPLTPIVAIPIEEAEADPAARDAAWRSFLTFARAAKEPGRGTGWAHPFGTRDEWYDEMIDERSK